MQPKETDVDEIVAQIAKARELLQGAESNLSKLTFSNDRFSTIADATRLEEALHSATHELGNNLGFYLEEIDILRQRLRLRRRYDLLTDEEFERIIREDWSISLVRDLWHTIHIRTPASLEWVSTMTKTLRSEWDSIPKR